MEWYRIFNFLLNLVKKITIVILYQEVVHDELQLPINARAIHIHMDIWQVHKCTKSNEPSLEEFGMEYAPQICVHSSQLTQYWTLWFDRLIWTQSHDSSHETNNYLHICIYFNGFTTSFIYIYPSWNELDFINLDSI